MDEWTPPIPMIIWPPEQLIALQLAGAVNPQLFVQFNIYGAMSGRFGISWDSWDYPGHVLYKNFANAYFIPPEFLLSLYNQCYAQLLANQPPFPPVE